MTRPPHARRIGVAAGLLLVALAPIAQAQQLKRKERHKDWSVFVQEQGANKYCFAATTPTQSAASRGGKALNSITRDKALLRVSTFPSRKAKDEVSVRVGYPIDQNKTTTLRIGSKSFTMFSDGEEAWAQGPAEDEQIVGEFRRGANATITAVSTRGTTVKDEFSLLGFTDAVASMNKLCR